MEKPHGDVLAEVSADRHHQLADMRASEPSTLAVPSPSDLKAPVIVDGDKYLHCALYECLTYRILEHNKMVVVLPARF